MKKFVIFKVESINTCEQAEMLRNKPVFADLHISESVISYVDYCVTLNGNILGKVTDISNFGSKDIISISGEKDIMCPLVDGLIIKVDSDNKCIDLNSEIFEQVAVYEN